MTEEENMRKSYKNIAVADLTGLDLGGHIGFNGTALGTIDRIRHECATTTVYYKPKRSSYIPEELTVPPSTIVTVSK